MKRNLYIDCLMFLILCGIFTVRGEMHEFFGTFLGILVIVHIILHWKQLKVMFRKTAV